MKSSTTDAVTYTRPSCNGRSEPADVFCPYTLDDARRDMQAAGMALPTGYPELDSTGFRFQRGKLYVVAGRPGEGKTTLMLNLIMRHVEQRAKCLSPPELKLPGTVDVPSRSDRQADDRWANLRGPAVYVSYEDCKRHTYAKLLLRQVAVGRLQQGKPAGAPPRAVVERYILGRAITGGDRAAEWQDELANAAKILDDYQEAGLLAIVDGDQAGSNINKLLKSFRARAQTDGVAPSLLALDYFQKIRPPRSLRASARQQQLQEIADVLRKYAKGEWEGVVRPELAVPILTGAQVNRDRLGRVPELANIREADDLAQDASGVITLCRSGVDDGMIKCKLVKNREGKRDVTFNLNFAGDCSLITPSLDHGTSQNSPPDVNFNAVFQS